nr:ABC transporter permease subunit [uncultured Acetatifactor sp.]
MLLPMVIFLLIYSYYPMSGILIAFERYNPRLGFFRSPWIGLDNFEYIFKMPNTGQILYNTVSISLMKMLFGLIVPIVFAVLLDLVKHSGYKRSIQTLIYIPYFLSWIVLSGILIDILSPSTGIVNQILGFFGIEPIFFLGNEKLFPGVLIVSDVWKGFGYGTVVYLAAITSIDMELYDAAKIDGANRMKQVRYVTLPGIMPIIVLMATLSLGNILNAGFDQILNLYNPTVMKTGDIIDTFVYRIGLQNNQYGIASAMGLFKSVVSFAFISMGYTLAYKFADYRVF